MNDSLTANARCVSAVHDLQNKVYLELGIGRGETFRSVRARVKIGVDVAAGPGTHQMRTDDFFARFDEMGLERPDVVLVDADHSHRQVLADLNNALRVLQPRGVVLCHDMIPPNANLTRTNRCGDAFRALHALMIHGVPHFSMRGNFGMTAVPHGCGEVPLSEQSACIDYATFMECLGDDQSLTESAFLARIEEVTRG